MDLPSLRYFRTFFGTRCSYAWLEGHRCMAIKLRRCQQIRVRVSGSGESAKTWSHWSHFNNSFPPALKMAWDNNGTYVEATLSLFLYFLRKDTDAPIPKGLLLTAKLLHFFLKEGVLRKNCQVVKHLLQTYATEDITTETSSEIARFVKPSNMSCRDWDLVMSVGSRNLDFHTIMTSRSSRKSSSKDYRSLSDPIRNNSGADRKMRQCRNWRITPRPWQNCKQQYTWVSSSTCICQHV